MEINMQRINELARKAKKQEGLTPAEKKSRSCGEDILQP